MKPRKASAKDTTKVYSATGFTTIGEIWSRSPRIRAYVRIWRLIRAHVDISGAWYPEAHKRTWELEAEMHPNDRSDAFGLVGWETSL